MAKVRFSTAPGYEGFKIGYTPVIKGIDAKRARLRLGVPQTEFARHMGVSSKTVQNWERNPDFWITDPCRAREIATLLAMSTDH